MCVISNWLPSQNSQKRDVKLEVSGYMKLSFEGGTRDEEKEDKRADKSKEKKNGFEAEGDKTFQSFQCSFRRFQLQPGLKWMEPK